MSESNGLVTVRSRLSHSETVAALTADIQKRGATIFAPVSLFGGTAEYVALWFKQAGNASGFYWYASTVIACTLVVYLFMRDTKKHSHIDAEQR